MHFGQLPLQTTLQCKSIMAGTTPRSNACKLPQEMGNHNEANENHWALRRSSTTTKATGPCSNFCSCKPPGPRRCVHLNADARKHGTRLERFVFSQQLLPLLLLPQSLTPVGQAQPATTGYLWRASAQSLPNVMLAAGCPRRPTFLPHSRSLLRINILRRSPGKQVSGQWLRTFRYMHIDNRIRWRHLVA